MLTTYAERSAPELLHAGFHKQRVPLVGPQRQASPHSCKYSSPGGTWHRHFQQFLGQIELPVHTLSISTGTIQAQAHWHANLGTGPLTCKPGHRPIGMQTWAQAHWHANLGTGPLTGSGKAGASPASTCRTLQRLQCRGGAGPRLAGPRLAGPRFAAPALPVLACI